MKDLRYALRRWTRRPGFAVTAVLILALGIGATTAIFSVVDAVLLRPLPFTAPDRLVVIHAVRPERRHNPATAATWNRGALSWPAWDALRQVPAFEAVGVWRIVTQTFGEQREDIVPTLHVSASFLPTLGAALSHGRHFTPAEDDSQSDSIILSHESWLRRFGGRSDIVGREVTIGHASSGDQMKKTIVGVLKPDFSFQGMRPECLIPVGYLAHTGRLYPSATFRSVARLAPGVSPDGAFAAAEAAVRNAERKEPASVRLVPLTAEYVGDTARPLWLLFGGAALLLLVACANVAGLLLGEGRARRHEIAVRLALGGGRARVLRQLVVEHLLLAAAGAAAGLFFGAWLTQALVALAPEGLPRLDTVTIDLRVAAFALAVGLVTLLLFGVAPAWLLVRTPAAEVLAEGGRGAMSRRHLGQRAIVAAEIALALVLIVGASLFGETMYRLTSQPLGFDPSDLAVASTTFTGYRWGPPAAVREARRAQDFGRRMQRLESATSAARTEIVLARLSSIPGVLNAAGVSAVPFIAPPLEINIRVDGTTSAEEHRVHRQVVTQHYFEVMRIPIVQGRGFDASDNWGANAAVVSRELARRFPGDSALGRRFSHKWGPEATHINTYDVVGVVPNIKAREFSDDDAPAFYVLDRQSSGVTHFVVRTSTAAAILPQVRQAIAEVDPQIVVTATNTIEAMVAKSIGEERFRATLSVMFGAAALVLAAVGLYGLAARRVSERRREFGVRVALGAAPADVRRLVLRDAWIIVALGVLAGLPAAYGASQVTRAFLFGVSPTAPHIFAIAACVLGAAAVLATIAPAHRAGRTDPMLALRE